MTDTPRPQITLPDMCRTHQALLVHQLDIGPDGPWRSTIIVAQIVLFQGVTARPGTYEKIGGDVTRLPELGCLACEAPDIFGKVVDTWQRSGMAAVKALGESYASAASVDQGDNEDEDEDD